MEEKMEENKWEIINQKFIHKETGTEFDPEGFNKFGLDKDGYDKYGFSHLKRNFGVHKETGTKRDLMVTVQ